MVKGKFCVKQHRLTTIYLTKANMAASSASNKYLKRWKLRQGWYEAYYQLKSCERRVGEFLFSLLTNRTDSTRFQLTNVEFVAHFAQEQRIICVLPLKGELQISTSEKLELSFVTNWSVNINRTWNLLIAGKENIVVKPHGDDFLSWWRAFLLPSWSTVLLCIFIWHSIKCVFMSASNIFMRRCKSLFNERSSCILIRLPTHRHRCNV